MKKENIYKFLLIGLFALISIAVPVATIISSAQLPENAFSENENRYLEKMPKFNFDTVTDKTGGDEGIAPYGWFIKVRLCNGRNTEKPRRDHRNRGGVGTPERIRTAGLPLRSTAYHFVNCSYHIFPCCFFANCAAWRQVNLHKFP